MIRRGLLALGMFMWMHQSGFAQCLNLVPNGSFEEFTALPDSDCDWALATGWNNAALSGNCNTTNGTPDYYHLQGNGIFSSLPINYFAEVNPLDGDAVMGLAGHINVAPGSREYIATALTAPLVVGETYTLQYALTTGDPLVGGFYTNGWGASLSVGPQLQPAGTNSVIAIADFPFSTPGIFDVSVWQTLSFTFVADQPYDHITIGNFFDDAAQALQPFGTQGTLSIAYVFFDDISIVPLTVDDLEVSLEDLEICPGEEAVLNAVTTGGLPPYTYTWSPNIGNTGGPITVAPSATTTYTVEVTDCDGNTATASAEVTVIDEDLSLDLGPDQQLCSGSILLNATIPGGLSYQWNTGQSTAIVSPIEPGTYSVTVTGLCGSVTDEIIITECGSTFGVSLGPTANICPGGAATIFADVSGGVPPYSFNWTPNLGTDEGPYSVSPAFNTIYTVEVTDATGAVATATTTVAVINENLSLDLGPDTDLCDGNVLLDAFTVAGQLYTWSTGATTSAILVSTPGTYFVTVTGLCGSLTDEVVVSECTPELGVDLGEGQDICPGGSASIFANASGGVPPYTYVWTPNIGTTAGPISVSPASTTSYMVVVSDAEGSTVEATTLVTVLEEVLTIDLGADQELCDGTVTLDATTTGAQGYVWNTGATTATITVGNPDTYSVTVTGLCTSVNDAVDVTPCIPELTVSLGADQTICLGAATTLQAEVNGGVPPYSYAWTPNLGNTAGPFTVSPTTSSLYSLTLNDAEGSTVVASVSINVVTEIPFFDLGEERLLCRDFSLVLNANIPEGLDYLWSTGSTNPLLPVSAEGTYTVEVTTLCATLTDSVRVVNGEPAIPDYPRSARICDGDTVRIGPDVAADLFLLWDDGEVNSPRLADQGGLYTAEVNSLCGIREIRVAVEAFNCDCDIYVPNAFTPNEDGLNDLFGPEVNCSFDTYEFAVFNRWGEEVFRSSSPEERWNGSNSGNGYFGENDVYAWRLVLQPSADFVARAPVQLGGTVTVLR
jgi:gliding motility-associated-like protein